MPPDSSTPLPFQCSIDPTTGCSRVSTWFCGLKSEGGDASHVPGPPDIISRLAPCSLPPTRVPLCCTHTLTCARRAHFNASQSYHRCCCRSAPLPSRCIATQAARQLPTQLSWVFLSRPRCVWPFPCCVCAWVRSFAQHFRLALHAYGPPCDLGIHTCSYSSSSSPSHSLLLLLLPLLHPHPRHRLLLTMAILITAVRVPHGAEARVCVRYDRRPLRREAVLQVRGA